MRKETEIVLGVTGGLLFAVATSFELSHWAFFRSTGKEIFDRDHGICQGAIQGRDHYACIWEYYGKRGVATWQKGFKVSSAHFPENHGHEDDNPEAGRILCVLCHAVEEHLRGDDWGAKDLLRKGVYREEKASEMLGQWYPTLEDLTFLREHFLIKRGKYGGESSEA